MRFFIILLLSFSPIINLFCQDNFVPGEVTLSNGEKLNGTINDQYWDGTPSSIQFKDKDGKVLEFYPKDLLDFQIGQKSIYLSRQVEIDSVLSEKAEVVNNKYPNYVKKRLFLKVLVKGSKSLLVYAGHEDHYFIQINDKIEELINHHYNARIDGNVIKLVNKQYIFQLDQAFSDCSSAKPSPKLFYKHDALIDLFSRYMTCKGEEAKTYRRKEKTVIKTGLVGTAAYDHMSKGFQGGAGFGAGGFLSIYVPTKVFKHSLYAEVAYRMFGDQLWKGLDYAGVPYKETHQIRSIKTTVLTRWHLNKKPGLPNSGYTYVGAGAAVSFGLEDLYQRGPYVARSAAPFVGVIVSGGIYLTKHVALDMRIEQGSAVHYNDLVLLDNRQPMSKGYTSIQANLLIEF